MKKILFVLCLFFSMNLLAQNSDVTIGTKHSLDSEILGENRPYYIYLPEGYSSGGEAVSVMYLLDGSSHFHHTTGIIHFLQNNGIIPPMIVVAIHNTSDRTRDLTPAIVKKQSEKKKFPTAGGANNMLAFIETELIPEIEKNYNIGPYKILVGHSFGGLFSMHALIEKPELFDAHISISPSLWWDDQSLVERVENLLESRDEIDTYYYMTMGNEGGSMLGGAMKIAALFEEHAPEHFDWHFEPMEKETHGSVPHRSTYDGLEKIFSSWYQSDLAEIYAKKGWDGINAHYDKIAKNLGIKKEPSESDINRLGYNLMGADLMSDALEVFKENIARYPQSFNTYDSYAEGLMNNGDEAGAIKYYKKSLEVFPCNVNAVNILADMDVTYDAEKAFIAMSEKELKPYVGTYAFDQGGVAEIFIEDGELVLKSYQIDRQTLSGYGDHRFCVKPTNYLLTFIQKDGEFNSIEVQTGFGNTVNGKRTEP